MGRYDVYEDCELTGASRFKLEYCRVFDSERFRTQTMEILLKAQNKAGAFKTDNVKSWMEAFAVILPQFTYIARKAIDEVLDKNADKIRGSRRKNLHECADLITEKVFEEILKNT